MCPFEVLMYSENLVPTVCKALYDPCADVRVAAAATFDVFVGTVGQQGMMEVLGPLLNQLVCQKRSICPSRKLTLSCSRMMQKSARRHWMVSGRLFW